MYNIAPSTSANDACVEALGSGTINQVWHAQEAVRVLKFVMEFYRDHGEEDPCGGTIGKGRA